MRESSQDFQTARFADFRRLGLAAGASGAGRAVAVPGWPRAVTGTVTFGLANRLMANAIVANSVAGKTVKSSRMLRTRGGPVAIMRRKEWLLIGRDPRLMSQIIMHWT